jgi:hypothetical protein
VEEQYAGVSVNELKRVQELESENIWLKKMYAEFALEIVVLLLLRIRSPTCPVA